MFFSHRNRFSRNPQAHQPSAVEKAYYESKFKKNQQLLFVKTEENERLNYQKDVADRRTVFHTQAPKLKYTSDIIEEDDVLEGINRFGKDNNIDLVVAVTQHRRFWGRILHSSKTKELAIYSELPVLVIKADD